MSPDQQLTKPAYNLLNKTHKETVKKTVHSLLSPHTSKMQRKPHVTNDENISYLNTVTLSPSIEASIMMELVESCDVNAPTNYSGEGLSMFHSTYIPM